MPTTVEQLAAMPVFGGRSTRRSAGTWFGAIEAARALPESELPPAHLPASGPPPPRSWAERDPAAAARLAALRAGVGAVADAHKLPTENLLAPDHLRRIAWTPPDDASVTGIERTLANFGARPWQVDLTAEVIVAGLAAAAAAIDAKAHDNATTRTTTRPDDAEEISVTSSAGVSSPLFGRLGQSRSCSTRSRPRSHCRWSKAPSEPKALTASRASSSAWWVLSWKNRPKRPNEVTDGMPRSQASSPCRSRS